MIAKLKPIKVIQTEQKPYWSHPVFSKHVDDVLGGEECLSKDQLKQIESYFDIEIKIISMNLDAPEELSDRYCNGDNSALLDWNVSRPTDSLDWFLVLISDTEDGAVAWWAIPKSKLIQ